MLLDQQALNFNQVTADVQLVYDCATLKEVDFVKLKPMDFKLKPSDDGDQLSVEIRIKVLTSQLEDMFFRVRIALIDPRTMQELSPLFIVLSHPIRVVSKPDQVKKKIKKRKRAPTDNLMDTLTRIEVQQKEQQRLLKKLCVSPTSDAVHTQTESSSTQETTDGFHAAFTEFLSAFKQLSPVDENVYKVNTSAQDAQTMCEILDLIRAELKRSGLHSLPSSSSSSSSSSSHYVSIPSLTLPIIDVPSSVPEPLSILSSNSPAHSPSHSPSSSPPSSSSSSHVSNSPSPPSSTSSPPSSCEKVDRLYSLEGELFSDSLPSGQCACMPYSFAPFHDLSTMFATQ